MVDAQTVITAALSYSIANPMPKLGRRAYIGYFSLGTLNVVRVRKAGSPRGILRVEYAGVIITKIFHMSPDQKVELVSVKR